MSQPATLGELIRERRLAHAMSLSQFARAVEVPVAEARRWERGEAEPDAITRGRIAEVIDVDTAVLVTAPGAAIPGPGDDTADAEVEAAAGDPTHDTHLAAAGVVAAASGVAVDETESLGAVATDTDEGAMVDEMTEEPTQAIGAPFVVAEPTTNETMLLAVGEPEAPRRFSWRHLYDPDRPWLHYFRAALTVGVLLLLGLALIRLMPQLFDALSQLLDTIQTESDLESEVEALGVL